MYRIRIGFWLGPRDKQGRAKPHVRIEENVKIAISMHYLMIASTFWVYVVLVYLES